ncbi:unnamed protein product [Bemisia tabaci]|uniref:Secreted protein n=1 Tax=Bemisia tabaci TaxID=7038 RepID=A0A9P0AIG4_BEMTA|nr:unnamed protein product [Bemisia tabaci]
MPALGFLSCAYLVKALCICIESTVAISTNHANRDHPQLPASSLNLETTSRDQPKRSPANTVPVECSKEQRIEAGVLRVRAGIAQRVHADAAAASRRRSCKSSREESRSSKDREGSQALLEDTLRGPTPYPMVVLPVGGGYWLDCQEKPDSTCPSSPTWRPKIETDDTAKCYRKYFLGRVVSVALQFMKPFVSARTYKNFSGAAKSSAPNFGTNTGTCVGRVTREGSSGKSVCRLRRFACNYRKVGRTSWRSGGGGRALTPYRSARN